MSTLTIGRLGLLLLGIWLILTASVQLFGLAVAGTVLAILAFIVGILLVLWVVTS